ncbi:MAG: hypothetical protein Q4B85_05245 [Lachnospiraceae bacterium]|nr:hypothetical protein [Lachnospiraceae bacterium]
MRKKICMISGVAMLTAAFSGCGGDAANTVSEINGGDETAAYLYGTMEIPYDEFYAAEGIASGVDMVSSATNSKWKNENLTAGTYSIPHEEDEGGDILGVVYPVAITQEDLDALGDENYGFTVLEQQPEAYKIVSVENQSAAFSSVQGAEEELEAGVTLSTNTAYGDYSLKVEGIYDEEGNSALGVIYGAMVKTEDGAVYGMRHLENIWRDELAWSVGFVTEERHGNELSSEPYEDMMGKTIHEILFITENGYSSLAAEIYLPYKFDGGVEVTSVPVDEEAAEVVFTNLPDDFEPEYTVENLSFEMEGTSLRYADALPGAYTLVVSDQQGKYANLLSEFVLSTDQLPVVFNEETQMLEKEAEEEETLFRTFLSNITTVTVNGVEYRASGNGAAAIVTTDGSIDPEAVVMKGHGPEAETEPVFAESGLYELSVKAVGFEQAISFTIDVQKEEV